MAVKKSSAISTAIYHSRENRKKIRLGWINDEKITIFICNLQFELQKHFKGFKTGDTTDELWFLSTSRNSPRKGTCKIYKTFDRIFNFWTYQDLTCQGKAISIEMCMVFQRVAEPNNSIRVRNSPKKVNVKILLK